MGDHRAYIKIDFEFHGENYTMDANINYWGFDGVDERIIKFFEDSWSDGYGRFQDEVCESERKDRERKEKERELSELKRLKAKYGELDDE